jgi:hypothetical protein
LATSEREKERSISSCKHNIPVSFKFTEKKAALSNFYVVFIIIIIIIIIIIALLVNNYYMMFSAANHFIDAYGFLVFISFTHTTLDRPVDCQQPRG